jgi:hypothetical protein
MLNAQEKEWLERRKNLCNRCAKAAWCRIRDKHGYNTERCRFWEIKVPNQGFLGRFDEDFKDAAEFEARVAETLLRRTCFNCPDCPDDCPTSFEHPRRTGKDCRLKRARLAVEAAMEKG